MSEFLWGLLLSIPIGIAVNLVSPAFGSYLEKRSEKVAKRREIERKEFANEAISLATDQTTYYTFLLGAVLRTTYIGALIGILTGVLAAVGQGISAVGIYRFSQFFFLGSQLAALAGAILVLNIARNALVMIKEVRRIRLREARGDITTPSDGVSD
ncbi:hypothetical protein ACFY36_32960 [Actinoplanes sp. NPDC000266]